jgi:hypothetical protein
MSPDDAQRPGGAEDLDEKIAAAWGERASERGSERAGAGPAPAELKRQLRIQRIALGVSWLLMLPVFTWLIWPWIDEMAGAGSAPELARVRGAEAELEGVRGKLRALREQRAAAPRAGKKTDEEVALEEKERELQRLIAGSARHREDTDTRVAVGAAGLVIWLIMIALVLRGRARRAPAGGA